MMENQLSKLMELVGEEGLKSFVLDYADEHSQFKADLTAFIHENYVGQDEADIDYRQEVEWAFAETRDEGDRWHSYEVTDWCAIDANLDKLFKQADILLEAGNAKAALGIGVQYFISLNETCQETEYYDEDYDPDYSARKAKNLILKSIGAANVSSEARQEAFDAIGKLANGNAIEYCNVNFGDLLVEMTVKTATAEEDFSEVKWQETILRINSMKGGLQGEIAKEKHSDKLTGFYVSEIRDYAAKNMGRDHYRRIANAMREMQRLKDGHESARILADELRLKYSNRRAMKEELKEF